MLLLLQLLVFFISFISHKHDAMAAYVPPYTYVVIPVHKHTDAAKPLYSVEIMTSYVNMQFLHANFLIDIDVPFIWHDCILEWNIIARGICPANTLCTYPVSCEEYQCTDVRTSYSYNNPSCAPETNSLTLPGWGYCTCEINVVNPVTGSCGQAMLNYDGFTVDTTNSEHVLMWFYGAYPNAACAPSSSFVSFPTNVTGVMAFSSSPYAMSAYLYQPLMKSFALCLPSKPSDNGVLFFGNGPYYLLPQSDVNITTYPSYTPLLKQPNSFGYFIRVNSIVIKKSSINIRANATTKLSTIDPYTILRTDIYNGVVRRISKDTKRIPPAKPVAPFGLCYNSTSITGLKVPDIDFILPDEKKWRVSTANSIKQITNDVACFAFVDGGATSEPAIVIGTFQFEDNFLLFDLENSSFGFSSSLLRTEAHFLCKLQFYAYQRPLKAEAI